MGENKTQPRQALYRRYRSKSLTELVGQDQVTKTLANALKKGMISHAYLFTGPHGTGKTSVARILAHEINNIPYTDDSQHLDIIEIDAASNRRIDDIRELREKVHIAPVSAKYKVYIIDEVHMLTTESFNALLKTLEEPPAHVIFILATTEVHKLPATIVSRTQRHSFKSPSAEVVAKHLQFIAKQEGIDIDKAALQLLAEHGGGSFRDSVSLLDQVSSSNQPIDAALIESLLGLASSNSISALRTAITKSILSEILNIITSLIEAGLTPGGIAQQLIASLRQSLDGPDAETTAAVALMGQLLEVSSAAYPQLKLETILLQAALPASSGQTNQSATTNPVINEVNTAVQPTPIEQPASIPSKPAVKPVPKAAEKSKPKIDTPKPVILKKTNGPTTDADITQLWPDILDAIKQKNNPLYTILRLAQPELHGDLLTLSFGFTFHQKRVDDSKHKLIVATAAKEVLGQPVTVNTTVDPKLASKPAEQAAVDPAHASLVDQVRDIMGGGEVVNV